MQHPLDETFNMAPDENIKEILGVDIKIPKDPTLKTVVELALKQYKDLIEESMLLEPDQRMRHVEMAREYLRIAKDAMRDESDLEIKYKKVAGLPNPRVQPKGLEDKGKGKDIFDEIAELKKEKQSK